MLPALSREETLPRNLILPDRRTYHPMPPVQNCARPVDNMKRGSMAGRAVLTHIKNAPAQKPGR